MFIYIKRVSCCVLSGEPGLPSIELPEAPNANEGMKIVCNGSVGRDADGNQRASVHLEVADEDVGDDFKTI